MEQYPHLHPSQIHDALAYAYTHPIEIEEADTSRTEFYNSMTGAKEVSEQIRDRLKADLY